MKWSFEIEGEPPSWNHSYKQVVVIKDGRPYRTLAKQPEVATYQTVVTLACKFRRPKGWAPTGQIRLYYDFYLRRDKDADNMLKGINDAIAVALNINDKMFLPCVRSKVVVKTDPKVVVEIDDGRA